MSVIIIPRKHLRQPQGRVTADLGGLARGLVVLQNGHDFAVGSGVPVGAPPCVVTPEGLGFSSEPGKYFTGASPYQPPTGGEFTVAFEMYRRAIQGEQTGLWTFGTTPVEGDPRLLIAANSILFNVFWSGSYQISAQWPAVVGQRVRVVFSHRAGTGRLWVNGALLGSSATLLSGGNVTNWYLGIGYSVAPNANFVWHAQWSRGLSEAEAVELSINPWQLFRADPIRIYSLPSGPIIPISLSIAVSNITSIGARNTVTLAF